MDSLLIMYAYIKQSKGNSFDELQFNMRLLRSLIFIFFGMDKNLVKKSQFAKLLDVNFNDKIENQLFLNEV